MNSLKQAVKSAVSQLPGSGWTKRFPFISKVDRWKYDRMCDELMRRTGDKVFCGPFANMKIVPGSHLSKSPPMVVGSYELEVSDILQEVITRQPKQVIDIGSAHGYYTVGMGCYVPDAKIIGFEAEPEIHWDEARRLAELNGVTNVVQEGFCSPEDLLRVCEPDAFILCDCEGAEKVILDPDIVPNLRTALIVCELHDFYSQGVTPHLIKEFHETHHLEIRSEQGRDPSRYRVLNGMPRALQEIAVMEPRFVVRALTGGRHMILRPRQGFWATD